MKRVPQLLAVFLAVVLLCPGCAYQVNIRFVNRAGEDLVFAIPQSRDDGPAQTNAAPAQPAAEAPAVTELPSVTPSTGEAGAEPSAATPQAEKETSAAQPDLHTKEEILAFYRNAVKRVRSGQAGYRKKTWQSARVLQMTGIQAVDSFINTELAKRATSEADAETIAYEKGTQDAISFFPDCTLTDAGRIVSATVKTDGDRLLLNIVMQDENTPESIQNSVLGQITDIILFRNEIERNIQETLSAVKDYQYTILYKGFEVSCEMTKDGRFLSLRHHAYAEIHIATARILFVTLNDKDASLIMDADFSDFVY